MLVLGMSLCRFWPHRKRERLDRYCDSKYRHFLYQGTVDVYAGAVERTLASEAHLMSDHEHGHAVVREVPHNREHLKANLGIE